MKQKEQIRMLVLSCLQHIGEQVLLQGWAQAVRGHGKIAFMDLKDRSGVIQVVGESEEVAQKIAHTSIQEVVQVKGIVKKREERYVNEKIPTGIIEVEAKEIFTIQKSSPMPFDMGGTDLHLELPTLLDNRTLTLRHPKISSIFKIQETIVNAFRDILKKQQFTEVFVPTIVPSVTEGGAEVFSVDYYGHKTYLGQSPQLYKQMMVSVFERVFTVAHAYRAEPSVTTRHLSEYISLDAEMGFVTSFGELMDIAEIVVKTMFEKVLATNEHELRILGAVLPSLGNKFPRITMAEAQELVFKRTKKDNRQEPDLDPAGEKEICLWAQEEHGVPFVFITHFPTKKRPFYTMPDPQDPDYTLSFDLLGVNEEWVTGGKRVHDYDLLLHKIKERGNRPEDFELYLQAFKYGMPPEGGFAMGLERITKDMLGLSNVREASLFPRDMERVDKHL